MPVPVTVADSGVGLGLSEADAVSEDEPEGVDMMDSVAVLESDGAMLPVVEGDSVGLDEGLQDGVSAAVPLGVNVWLLLSVPLREAVDDCVSLRVPDSEELPVAESEPVMEAEMLGDTDGEDVTLAVKEVDGE